MELFKLFGTIAINNSEANSAIDATTGKAETGQGKMVDAFKKIGSAVVTYFAVDKIKDFGLACIEAAADAGAMESQFTQVFGDMESAASDSLSAIAKETGVLENRMKGSYTKIASFAKVSGMDTAEALDLANRSMIAIADSAAFYDRSLEETTESLQSFLKGNYENDSALGVSCTEVTRNTKANELYGQSFNDLSEAQKQLTLLAMVEEANELGGAMGQAARESETWTNQTGNLKQSWTDFLAVIGKPVLEKAIPIIKGIADGIAWFTDKIKEGEGASAIFVDVLESIFGEEKATQIQDFFTGLQETLQPLIEVYLAGLVEKFEMLGTWWEEVILPALTSLCEWFTQVATTIGENVAPAIEDIATKFIELYQTVEEVIVTYIIPFIQSLIGMVQELWEENQDKITKIGELFRTVFDAIAGLVAWFVDIFKGYIVPFFTWLIECVENNLGAIKDYFQSIFDYIGGIVDFFIALFQGDWSGMWEAVKNILNSAWEFITNIFNLIVTFITSIGSTIWSVVTNAWENVYTAIYSKITKIKDSISTVFTNIKTTVSSIFGSMKDAVAGVFEGMWSAIKGTINKILGGIETMANGVVSGINKLLDGVEAIANAAGELLGFDPVSISLSTVSLPRLAKGGVLEKGQVGLLEGSGAEAVVPLEQNREWIQRVTQEFQSQGVGSDNGKVVELLNRIIELLLLLVESNDELPDYLVEAIANLKFSLNNREFARLVKAVQ